MSENIRLSSVGFGADGLVPVVTQESRFGDHSLAAHADRDAFDRTLTTGLAHHFSRSPGTLWQHGETSGQALGVTGVRRECERPSPGVC